jgi:hypothetical protein
MRPPIPLEGVVLDGGKSDHNPYIRRLWYDQRPGAPGVTFCTFNIHRMNANELEPVWERILRYSPDVLGWQEVKAGKGVLKMIQRAGYHVEWEGPEFMVAYERERFNIAKSRDLVMSEHDYWLERNEALLVKAWDRHAEIYLKTISSHPPAHIVRRTHPSFENVLEVHKDVARKEERIAENSPGPVVVLRDSNIDPHRDRPVHNGTWSWAYRGYRYFRAPEGTHGRRDGRRIDEIKGSRMSATPVRKGRDQ